MIDEPMVPHCHAARDGECMWEECPQEKDGEPSKTGRHCPYDAAWTKYFEELEKLDYTS